MKAIVVVSGGLDSTTLLYYVIDQGYEPIVLTFDYGQKHRKEIRYAAVTCRKLGVKQHILRIPSLPGSSLTEEDVEIPKDDYSVETQKLTVVPNRNMVFLSIAASYAIANGCDEIFYAAHHNDIAVYPDCTSEFVGSLNRALWAGTYEAPKVKAPFIHKTKAAIVKIGQKLGLPFEETWSCYEGETYHCGKCGTCKERLEAFKIVGIEDPVKYRR